MSTLLVLLCHIREFQVMGERVKQLQQWLQQHLGMQNIHLEALTNDASFRRYFRLMINDNSYVVMDAPPSKEDCAPFVKVAKRLRASGLNAPEIIADHLEQGFLVLSDFGSQLYLSALNTQQADVLYNDALYALVRMQAYTSSEELPLYNNHLLHTEMNLFTDWLVGKHLYIELSTSEMTDLQSCFTLLSESALSQPQVFVHRDYHSRNLMVVPGHNPGILDFQDAVKGAVTYDLVSLLRDCYIAWSPEQIIQWVRYYYNLAVQAHVLHDIDESQLLRWFDWMGIQRHLKASGIFARLWHRDGKSGYLKDIPRTLNYIVEVSQKYPELAILHKFVQQRVLPLFLQKEQQVR